MRLKITTNIYSFIYNKELIRVNIQKNKPLLEKKQKLLVKTKLFLNNLTHFRTQNRNVRFYFKISIISNAKEKSEYSF